MVFIFSDRHAYLAAAQFYADPANLGEIDWDVLQRRDFKRDPNDPGKFERYEAELLVWAHLPVRALLGIVCCSEFVKEAIAADVKAADVNLRTVVQPSWYFS